MNFATWSIRNPLPVLILFISLSLLGLYGFNRLAIQNLPDIEPPTILVTLAEPGVNPAQLETEVARRAENAVATVAGLKHQRTTISEGTVQIVAEFRLEKKLADALTEVRNAIEQARNDFPADLRPPIVSAATIGSVAVDQYVVRAPAMSEVDLSWYIDNELSKALLALPGSASVERLGGVAREIDVLVRPSALAGLGVPVSLVSSALFDSQQQSSGGRASIAGLEHSARTLALAATAAELGAYSVSLGAGRSMRLDQFATVTDTTARQTQLALLDGQRTVGFRVYRSRGADEVRLSRAIAARLDQLHAVSPGISFVLINSRSAYSLEQYQGSMHMLIEGAFLAMLVVWWFLRDWRATLIAASALPLSVLPAFAVIYWLGYTLNTLTLLALSVVIGILVDDAIVEIENIDRHVLMGKSVWQATFDAVNEIAVAVIATTFTLVAVFVPTTLMAGMPGLFFRQFGWTAVVAVLSSLLVARLLTPMLAARFLKARRHPTTASGAFGLAYIAMVRWCLAHRRTSVGVAMASMLLAVAMVPFIETGFLPPADKGVTTVNFELSAGSSIEASEAVSEAIRAVLARLPGVARTFTSIGAPSSVGQDDAVAGEVRRGVATVILSERAGRPSQARIEQSISAALLQVPGARFSTGRDRLELSFSSDDAPALSLTVARVIAEMRSVGELVNISSSANLEQPELVVRPRLAVAAELGSSAAAIGQELRIASAGDFSERLAKLNQGQRQIPIRVMLGPRTREDLQQIGMLPIPTKTGTVPLASIAQLAIESGPAQIDRYDRQRVITVSAELAGTSLGMASDHAHQLASVKAKPASVSLTDTGDAELMTELLGSFGIAMLAGIAAILCILILLFKDLLQPVTVVAALPLSLCGAMAALLLARAQLNVPSLIGLLMLMGIVSKNAILLIDFAVASIKDGGMSVAEALLQACLCRSRPILMTSLAMIAGMLPIALGLGPDASFRQPMAVAVIGGLVSSTLLSLFFVPVMYSYLAQLTLWIKAKGTRGGGANA